MNDHISDTTRAVALKRRHVEERTKLSKSSLYDKLNSKSIYYDPHFPRPFNYVEGGAVYWLESEIEDWIKAQAAQNRTKRE